MSTSGAERTPINFKYEQMIEDLERRRGRSRPEKGLSFTPKCFFFVLALSMLCFLVAFVYLNHFALLKIWKVLKTLNASAVSFHKSNNSDGGGVEESPFILS